MHTRRDLVIRSHPDKKLHLPRHTAVRAGVRHHCGLNVPHALVTMAWASGGAHGLILPDSARWPFEQRVARYEMEAKRLPGDEQPLAPTDYARRVETTGQIS